MRTLGLLVLLSGFHGAAAHAACLPYAGRHELRGVLARQTFAGPPNFESVRRGDRPETYFVLRLGRPICVDDDPADKEGLNVGAKGVRTIQLMLDQPQYDRFRPMLGRTITLSGAFMSAITGHHHTPILLDKVQVVRR
jgi:hypothetical protein